MLPPVQKMEGKCWGWWVTVSPWVNRPSLFFSSQQHCTVAIAGLNKLFGLVTTSSYWTGEVEPACSLLRDHDADRFPRSLEHTAP